MPYVTTQELAALAQVLLVDITLAGDNAIVVGMAVAGLPGHQKRMAIILGIAAATVLRVLLGALTLQLLNVVGLILAGGILLLWVGWKLYRELCHPGETAETAAGQPAHAKTLRSSILQIVLADLSMSLDNVLAVAGAAEGHTWVLVVGLTVSVVLMGLVASAIATMLERYRWIAWAGLLIVLYIALKMIWDGGHEVIDTAWPGWLHPPHRFH